MGTVFVSPTRRIMRSCNTRRNFVWSESAMELTSSRKIVPALGFLEQADLVLERPGERALFVAEEFAFEQVLGQRGTVHRDERRALALAVEMQCAGDEFLARAALALDEDRAVGVGDLVDEVVDLLHRAAGADDVLEADNDS